MFEAEAIILDTEHIRRRLARYTYEATPELLTKIKNFLGRYWTAKRREQGKRCPRFVLDLKEYLERAGLTKADYHPPATYFLEGSKAQIPSRHRWNWNARICPESAPQLPLGELRTTYPESLNPPALTLPIQLRLTEEDLEILSPHNRDKFPDGSFYAYVFLTLCGPRGVIFDDVLVPEQCMGEPVPWMDHIEENTRLAEAQEAEDEDSEEDDDEGEEDEFDVPEGATCVHHPDRPAVGSWEIGYLCEECEAHYIDGFRPKD